MKTNVRTLIRFEDTNGVVRYGEVSDNVKDLEGRQVSTYTGIDPWDLQASADVATVSKVLAVLALPLQ